MDQPHPRKPRPPGHTEEATMHPSLSYYLAQADLRQLRPK